MSVSKYMYSWDSILKLYKEENTEKLGWNGTLHPYFWSGQEEKGKQLFKFVEKIIPYSFPKEVDSNKMREFLTITKIFTSRSEVLVYFMQRFEEFFPGELYGDKMWKFLNMISLLNKFVEYCKEHKVSPDNPDMIKVLEAIRNFLANNEGK